MRISGHWTHRRDVRVGGYPLGSLADSGQRGGVTGLRGILLAAGPACHGRGVRGMRREGAYVVSFALVCADVRGCRSARNLASISRV